MPAPAVLAASSPLISLLAMVLPLAPSRSSTALAVVVVIRLSETTLFEVPSSTTAWPVPVKLSSVSVTAVLFSASMATALPLPCRARPETVMPVAPVIASEPVSVTEPAGAVGAADRVRPLSAAPSASFSL